MSWITVSLGGGKRKEESKPEGVRRVESRKYAPRELEDRISVVCRISWAYNEEKT